MIDNSTPPPASWEVSKTEKACEWCSETFHTKYRRQRFCCVEHQHKAYKSGRPDDYGSRRLSCDGRGAMSELLVAADVICRGYEAYRATASQSSCDLVAIKGDTVLRIEVKTGQRSLDGELRCYVRNNQKGKHDTVAVVDPASGQITYIPARDVRYSP